MTEVSFELSVSTADAVTDGSVEMMLVVTMTLPAVMLRIRTSFGRQLKSVAIASMYRS